MCGNEVFEHRQTLAEIRRDGRFNNFSRRLGHQSAHAGQLPDLLLRSARAGVCHDVNRVHGSFVVCSLHVAEHFVCHLVGHRRPHLDHLVRALAVGDGAVHVLLLDFDHLLVGRIHRGVFAVRNHHVVQTHRQTGLGGIVEAQRLDAVQHANRDLKAQVLVAIVHQLPYALLLQQPVHIRHPLRQRVVQNHAAHRGRDVFLVEVDRLGVGQILVVIGRGHVQHLARIAQPDRRQRLHFPGFERHQDLFRVGKHPPLANAALLRLGQVIKTEHHVLRGHRNRLA